MTLSRRSHIWLEQSLDDELETLLAIVGMKQKSRLIAHLLDAALAPYRPAIIEAQRARQAVERRERDRAQPTALPLA